MTADHEVTAGLEQLDTVDWASLTHAYGSADNIPALIRDLSSPDAATRDAAAGALFNCLVHQGNRFEASAHAVPFLFGLLADPGAPARPAIAELLVGLAIGYEDDRLPAGLDIGRWRHDVREFCRSDAAERRWDGWVEAAGDDAEREYRLRRRATADIDRERRLVAADLAAYDAVRIGVPFLRTLFADPDPAVRAVGVFAVSWFPEEHTDLDAMIEDPDPVVAAQAMVACGLLGRREHVAALREHLSSFALLRWAAATALSRLGDNDDTTVSVLAHAVVDPPDGIGIFFHDGNLRRYAWRTLAAISSPAPETAIGIVLDGLTRRSGRDAWPLVTATLELAFGSRTVHRTQPAHSALEPRQQRAVAAIADLDETTWTDCAFGSGLRAHGLPEDRAELRRYAGLPRLRIPESMRHAGMPTSIVIYPDRDRRWRHAIYFVKAVMDGRLEVEPAGTREAARAAAEILVSEYHRDFHRREATVTWHPADDKGMILGDIRQSDQPCA